MNAFRKGSPLREVPKGWLKMESLSSNESFFNEIEKRIPKRISQRNLLNSIYDSCLPDSIKFPIKFQEWRYNIKIPTGKKEKIIKALFENKLFASSHYHSVNRLFNNDCFAVSDSLFNQVINLFNDDYYTEDQALMTCDIINKILS